MEFNPQKQLAGLLEWMDQQMTQCGGKTAVIGISGGKDSSTVAALAVAAYGRENVYGVLMPDDQLSLAIGKEGQNARLAARLTGYKIDIKPASYTGE